MNSSLRMKMLISVPLVLLTALVACAAYVADQLFGVVAFTNGYLVFCLLTALAFGGISLAFSKKAAVAVALVVFCILAANFFLPPPSERLLRSVMLVAGPGSDASTIVDIVKRQYEDSPYEMPWIHEDEAGGFDRVHVSLLPQKAGSCTSVIFLIEHGRVSRSIFSPD